MATVRDVEARVAWSDIPGVTEVDGRPCLPRRPDVAALLFQRLAAPDGPRTAPEAVDEVVGATGAARARVEGLAGWLPLSRVARWRADDGRLCLHPDTSAHDLALRYGAWAGSRPVKAEDVEAVTAYSREVAKATAGHRQPVGVREGMRWSAPAATGPARSEGPVPAHTVKLRGLLSALDDSFLERQHHLRASLLALLAGGHALLIGPPGTAKSMLARAIRSCFQDAVWFEYLLSRFTHPDELFGPVSIPGLKEEDYRRLTEGFLPTAHVAFLDEIFKANSAILNSLLTLINERMFHHGRHKDPVPLIGLLGASNELPEPEGGLGALYDRFLVRLGVPPLAEPESFLAVATGTVPTPHIDPEHTLTLDDLAAIRRDAQAVTVPPAVRAVLVGLWRHAADAEWGVSDRRWRQAVHMLKVAAAAEGRRAVNTTDLLLLEPVLAPEPERCGEVRDVLVDRVAPRAVPEHDLHAQWTLLRLDRVAPPPGDDEGWPPERPTAWSDRLALRRRHALRMVAHAEAATEALAADREAVAQRTDARLWLPRLPPRLLAAHIEAGRDLAKVLEAAETYAEGLTSEDAAAWALVQALPEPRDRSFGAGVAVRMRWTDLDREVGITLSGERSEPPARRAANPPPSHGPGTTAGVVPGVTPARHHLARAGQRRRDFEAEVYGRAPELTLTAAEWVGWLRGELTLDALLERLPAWSRRGVRDALSRARQRLGEDGVPPPPDLGSA